MHSKRLAAREVPILNFTAFANLRSVLLDASASVWLLSRTMAKFSVTTSILQPNLTAIGLSFVTSAKPMSALGGLAGGGLRSCS